MKTPNIVRDGGSRQHWSRHVQRVEEPTVAYFKTLAEDADVPDQTLINLYLRDCASSERRLDLRWRKRKAGD